MAKYSINDFQIGDTVYHLSNTSLKMVAIQINIELNEITCRWVDKNGKLQIVDFMPQELGKAKDLAIRIRAL